MRLKLTVDSDNDRYISIFREYLEDYASPATKEKGLRLLKELTQTFSKEELKRRVEGNLCKIGDGERDLYF